MLFFIESSLSNDDVVNAPTTYLNSPFNTVLSMADQELVEIARSEPSVLR